jgi:hypothetical protein
MTTQEKFFRKFDMQVYTSNRKLRRIPNMWQHTNAWNYSISDSTAYQYQLPPVEEVECVEVLMPKDRLDSIIDYIDEAGRQAERSQSERQLMARYEQDRVVRLANPAVEKAYQKYVMLLELARK